MHVESESIFARVRFISNLIDDAVSWGGDVSQVYVEGAAFTATSNSIQRCGKLDLQYYNYTQSESWTFNANYFAVDKTLWSNRKWT